MILLTNQVEHFVYTNQERKPSRFFLKRTSVEILNTKWK